MGVTRLNVLHSTTEVKLTHRMAFSLAQHARRPLPQILRRMLSTTAVRGCSAAPVRGGLNPEAPPKMIYPEDMDKFYPKIGQREVVGFGQNGLPEYNDLRDFPMPAIAFKEETAEIKALKEKERGDWAALTIDEKKQLYRHYYCSTFAEFTTPTGEWKNVWAIILGILTLTGLGMVFNQKFVYLPLRHNTPEYHAATIADAVLERSGPIQGISSLYDYEQRKWKRRL